eukprot:366247_1
MPRRGRYYMDPDYLHDALEQEWDTVTIVASDMPSVRKKNNNKKIIRDRRSQAIQRNTNKEKVKLKKAKAAQKRKLKKKMKAATVNSGDNQRKEQKDKRWVVLSTKKENKRHGRVRRHRNANSKKQARQTV